MMWSYYYYQPSEAEDEDERKLQTVKMETRETDHMFTAGTVFISNCGHVFGEDAWLAHILVFAGMFVSSPVSSPV